MNRMRILVTYAKEYDMTNEKGERQIGCTINYFFFGKAGEMMKPTSGLAGAVGYQRAKCSLDLDKRKRIKKAPAIYDAIMEMSIGSDGKPVMKVVDLTYVGDVNISLVETPTA